MIIHQSHPYNDQNQHPIFNSTLVITMIVHESYSYNLQNQHPIYISTLTTLNCRLDTPTKQKTTNLVKCITLPHTTIILSL
jgi:hypothetical protein